MKPLEADDPYVIGPYELLGRLGSGGMGEVFLGRQGRNGRLAAIKVARGEFADDAGFRRRFTREVQAARKVDGRFTAAVLGADPEARRPWLATAYIPAASLADAVVTSGALPESSLRALLAGIAAALEAIHTAGLTHRDLKPANVLLADDGPRVIDFGISHSSEHSQLTRTGQAPGTPGYMAPEQLRGTSPGPHTDVFALGATLVYAATGKGPFGVGEPMSLMYRVLEDEPQLDGVPDGLRDALARCLAKDPEQRPTVAALRAEFAVPQTVGERRWLPPQVSTLVELPEQLEPQRLDDPQRGGPRRQPDDPRQALAVPRGDYGPPPSTAGGPPSPNAAAQPPSPNAADQSPSPSTAGQRPSPNAAAQPPSPSTAAQPPSPNAAAQPPSPSAASQPPSPSTADQPPSPSTAGQPPSPNTPPSPGPAASPYGLAHPGHGTPPTPQTAAIPGTGTPGAPPRRRLSRRALLALTAGGVAAVGTGGTLAALEVMNEGEGGDGGKGGGRAQRSAAPGGEAADDGPGNRGEGSGPLPQIIAGKKLGRRPTVEKERGAAPEELVVRTLIRGSGRKVTKSDHVKCHYLIQEWTKAETVDNSYDRGEAFLIQIGTGQVIKGWEQAVLGQRAGSRVEVSIPPKLAYGDKGAGDRIPPDATLLSVIDILEVINVRD
ncbi:protein kinase domain-containing protein [Streptomyces sp. CA-250714]|uniref:protein kinase domain-containing protein n=1 Tax=Streptomyces sp. CA-250714 TaxID=3240060 RepID=UPI003D8BDF51